MKVEERDLEGAEPEQAQQTEQRAARGSDFAGLLPFVLGLFLAVVSVMGLLRPAEADPAGSAAVARALERSVGYAAALWFALALCTLGARWFLAGRSQSFLRNLLGHTGLAVGIALVAGALREGAGGNFGELSRRLMGEGIGAIAGALLGCGIFAGSAWVAWLSRRALPAWRKIESSPAPAARLGSIARGVTEEEAEALLPPSSADQESEEAGALASLPLSSPYPEDVRKRGAIPAGARPISPSGQPLDEPRQHAPQARPAGEDDAPGIYRWTPRAPSDAVQPADRDLAESARAAAQPAAVAGQPAAAEQRERTGGHEAAALSAPSAPGVAKPLPALPIDPEAGVRPIGVASAPPRPSWEAAAFVQEELFEQASVEQEEAIAQSFAPFEEEEEEEVADAAPARATAPVAIELDEPELDEADEDDEEDEAAEIPERSELDAELEQILSSPSAADAEDAEDADEASDSDEEEWEEEWEEESEEAGSELVAEDEAEDEDWDEEELEDEAEEEEEAAEAAELEEEPASASSEREVVIEPMAPPAGAQRKLPEVVVQAGCLFLERERVAVSMLQRQFGLDFEESCAVLDQLQESGLIGPYLGGQSRDILMTREEWMRKVGQV